MCGVEKGAVVLHDRQLALSIEREVAIDRNYLLSQLSHGIAALPFLPKNWLKHENEKQQGTETSVTF